MEKKWVLTGFILAAMTVDIEQLQSSKKKHKKDRKDSDDRKRNDRDLGVGDLVVTEVEGKKKKRKERKEEREGATDGALSFSLVLQRADSDALYAHTFVDVKDGKGKKKSTAIPGIPSDEADACQTSKATPSTEPEHKKRKKEKRRKKDADSDPTSMTDSRKAKKRKRKHDHFSEPDVAPSPPSQALPSASPKRPRVTISPAEAEAYLKTHGITVQLPPDIPALLPITSFDALPIPDSLRGTFSTFKKPTPIQACAWPPALSGRDVVGIAETGSGKTLAFGIPAVTRLLTSAGSVVGKGPRALVLAPTRELALQTYDVLSTLDAVPCAAVFGGVNKTQQARVLNEGVQVVVGTPGRVLDFIHDGVLSLGGVEYLVLDEADRMLDKGFENDIRRIIGYAKQGAERQTLMCTSVSCAPAMLLLTWSIVSATWPEAVRRLATSFLRDPVRITVGSDDLTANSSVAQGVLSVWNV
jgi:ATP-dependent RNA helicase DBP3